MSNLLVALPIIILLNIAVFYKTIWYGLILDDIVRYRIPHKPASKLRGYWRCLKSSLLYDMNHKVEHGLTLLIHTVVSCLIYLCLGMDTLAFMCSLLFAIHPVNTQVSIWLNGKRYGINAGIVLVMWVFKPLGLLLFPITLYWQVGALTAPLLYIYHNPWYIVFLPIVLAISYVVFTKVRVMGQHTTLVDIFKKRLNKCKPSDLGVFKVEKFIMYFKSIKFYLPHCLVPTKMSFYYPTMDEFEVTQKDTDEVYSINGDFWLGVVYVVGIVGLILMNYGNPIGLGLFWWLIFISLWCNCPFTMGQVVADRYCYLPNIGLMYALCFIFMQVPYGGYLYAVLFGSYLTHTCKFMESYRNADKCLQHVLFEFPNVSRARRLIVEACKGKWDETNNVFYKHNALIESLEGIKYKPHDYKLNAYVFLFSRSFGHLNGIERFLEVAKANPVVHFRDDCLAEVEEWEGQLDKQRAVAAHHQGQYDAMVRKEQGKGQGHGGKRSGGGKKKCRKGKR